MYRDYTRMERWIDGVVHAAGLSLSVVGLAILLDAVVPENDRRSIIAATVYGSGLVAMLWSSAAYNLITAPHWKEKVRPFDHAAIFWMIAGSYTPFALVTIGGAEGFFLLVVVWFLAIAGMFLKFFRPRKFERASIVLYLVLGWIGLPLTGLLVAVLPTRPLVLLAAGGLLYTAGVAFHLWDRLLYQNAVWHGFVLAAAICHFCAVLEVLAG